MKIYRLLTPDKPDMSDSKMIKRYLTYTSVPSGSFIPIRDLRFYPMVFHIDRPDLSDPENNT